MDKSIIPKPEIEIIEDGRVRVDERIDPSVMNFLMLAAQTSQLVKLRKLEESKIPIGTKSITINVIDTTISEVKLDNPWISFTLSNDGPGAIYLAINDVSGLLDRDAINSGEGHTIDMKYPIIKILYLKAVSGSSSVRIRAIVGNKND